jgi:hypothetical protein
MAVIIFFMSYKNKETKVAHISKISYHVLIQSCNLYQYTMLSSVDTTTKVSTFTTLLLPVAGN